MDSGEQYAMIVLVQLMLMLPVVNWDIQTILVMSTHQFSKFHEFIMMLLDCYVLNKNHILNGPFYIFNGSGHCRCLLRVFLVMDPVLNQFGWTMLDVQVHLLFVLVIVRVVHHLSIITVVIMRMSLWNVVSKMD